MAQGVRGARQPLCGVLRAGAQSVCAPRRRRGDRNASRARARVGPQSGGAPGAAALRGSCGVLLGGAPVASRLDGAQGDDGRGDCDCAKPSQRRRCAALRAAAADGRRAHRHDLCDRVRAGADSKRRVCRGRDCSARACQVELCAARAALPDARRGVLQAHQRRHDREHADVDSLLLARHRSAHEPPPAGPRHGPPCGRLRRSAHPQDRPQHRVGDQLLPLGAHGADARAPAVRVRHGASPRGAALHGGDARVARRQHRGCDRLVQRRPRGAHSAAVPARERDLADRAWARVHMPDGGRPQLEPRRGHFALLKGARVHDALCGHCPHLLEPRRALLAPDAPRPRHGRRRVDRVLQAGARDPAPRGHRQPCAGGPAPHEGRYGLHEGDPRVARRQRRARHRAVRGCGACS
eukprot:Amastigsp_a192_25.p2 type:complete len:409 gc:universal Amastigsp_a192_25:2836-1610(-)